MKGSEVVVNGSFGYRPVRGSGLRSGKRILMQDFNPYFTLNPLQSVVF